MIKIVSAARFEVEPLLAHLQKEKKLYEYLEIGIGVFQSMKTTLNHLDFFQNSDVYYFGTCGTVTSFHQPQVFAVKSVAWQSIGERLGKSHRIQNTDPVIPLAADGVDCICASNLSLSIESLAQDVVENVELYGVATALQNTSSKLRAFLCSTNQIGLQGHEQWVKHHQDATLSTRDFVIEKNLL